MCECVERCEYECVCVCLWKGVRMSECVCVFVERRENE